MLLLTFQVDRQLYGLDAKHVREIVPMLETRPLPGAPECVSGVFSYRGTLVPVVDVTRMIAGRPTRRQLSSRIILADYPSGGDAGNVLGLLAENVTGTEERDADGLAPTGVDVPEAAYLGKMSCEGKAMIQMVKIENLLDEDLKRRLFNGHGGEDR